jgi:hypothetical protein
MLELYIKTVNMVCQTTQEEHNKRKQPNLVANKYSMCIFATFGTTSVNHQKII